MPSTVNDAFSGIYDVTGHSSHRAASPGKQPWSQW